MSNLLKDPFPGLTPHQEQIVDLVGDIFGENKPEAARDKLRVYAAEAKLAKVEEENEQLRWRLWVIRDV